MGQNLLGQSSFVVLRPLDHLDGFIGQPDVPRQKRLDVLIGDFRDLPAEFRNIVENCLARTLLAFQGDYLGRDILCRISHLLEGFRDNPVAGYVNRRLDSDLCANASVSYR